MVALPLAASAVKQLLLLVSMYLVLPCVRLCAHLLVPSRSTWGRLPPRWPGVRDDAAGCAWGQRSVSNRVWQQGLWADAPCWARTRALAGQLTSVRLSNVPPWVPPRNLGGHFSTHRSRWHTAFQSCRFQQITAHRQHHTPSSTYTHTHVCSKSSHSHTHTPLHTPSFTAHLLSPTTFTYNSLTVRSYTISFVYDSLPCPLDLLFSSRHNFFTHFFYTQHCHTPSFTHIFVTHLSFTHNFATHNSSHTTFQLIDHPPPPLPILPFCFCLLEEVDLWGYPVLQFWKSVPRFF